MDPQWLCDVLSHVVTIREINPFAKNGIMRLEDLRHVFKSSSEISSYRLQNLHNYEVRLRSYKMMVATQPLPSTLYISK